MTEEPKHEIQYELQAPKDEDLDNIPVRGTRLLSDVYSRCNLAERKPIDVEEAMNSLVWMTIMKELIMIEKNETSRLIDRSTPKNIIGVKWTFKTTLSADGSINKHKVRFIVKGYS